MKRLFAERWKRRGAAFLWATLMLPLANCSVTPFRLFHPAGPVATTEWNITLIDTGIMALIVVPAGLMFCFFVWRYRATRNARYDPHWSNNVPIEIAMWVIPFITVSVLAYFSFRSVYEVNPYAPGALQYTSNSPTPRGGDNNALPIDVISTEWQWFFVYPNQKIAAIDDLVVPAGRQIDLRLTSTAVVNDFYVPQVAPMIDAMPGMRTKDNFEVDKPATFIGFSANFSGPGFAWMHFTLRVLPPAQYKAWVAATQKSHLHLSYAQFEKLAQPSINPTAKPAYYADVDPNLFVKVYHAARMGKTYPVPMDMTRHMAENLKYYTSRNDQQ